MAWSDAARAAALEMRQRRKAGEPWRRNRYSGAAYLSDPTRVGGTMAHNKILKRFKVRAVTNTQAMEKVKKSYRKKGYTNIKVVFEAARRLKGGGV
jgi:hypothetical protein